MLVDDHFISCVVRERNFLLMPIFCSDEGNQALQEFLISCNPKQQHSTALESYLIKPIQRILKYPLLLTQLKVRNHQINAGLVLSSQRENMRDLKFNLSVVSLSASLLSSHFKVNLIFSAVLIFLLSVDLFLFFAPFSWMGADVGCRSDWLLMIRVV